MNPKNRDLVVAEVGRRLLQYMTEGPVKFSSASFVLSPYEEAPLGIRGLNKVPASWFEDVKVPGFVVERVGRNGIRIW